MRSLYNIPSHKRTKYRIVFLIHDGKWNRLRMCIITILSFSGLSQRYTQIIQIYYHRKEERITMIRKLTK